MWMHWLHQLARLGVASLFHIDSRLLLQISLWHLWPQPELAARITNTYVTHVQGDNSQPHKLKHAIISLLHASTEHRQFPSQLPTDQYLPHMPAGTHERVLCNQVAVFHVRRVL